MAEKPGITRTSIADAEAQHKAETEAYQKELYDESSGETLVTVEAGYTDVIVELPPDEARRAIRKVDFRLVPLLSFLYLVAFIDRSNIGNAKIAGMEDDLDLSGLHYNIAVTMFFITYGLFEVPSNIVLKLWRPSIWIAILMFCWGLVMTLMGIVQSIEGLYAARFCLGIAEVCQDHDLVQ